MYIYIYICIYRQRARERIVDVRTPSPIHACAPPRQRAWRFCDSRSHGAGFCAWPRCGFDVRFCDPRSRDSVRGRGCMSPRCMAPGGGPFNYICVGVIIYCCMQCPPRARTCRGKGRGIQRPYTCICYNYAHIIHVDFIYTVTYIYIYIYIWVKYVGSQAELAPPPAVTTGAERTSVA
jgi:hypothetical protein